MKLTLDTPIIDLHLNKIAKLSAAMSRKLAVAIAGVAAKTDVDAVTLEDLLNYFPMRYEDRSNFLTLDKLEEGMEASVEINVRTAQGVRVGKNRGPRAAPLFIFEITGGDAERALRPVVVRWFVSGRNAGQIEEREAQVDRHSPGLLLGEAVRVRPGQSLNQGRLSVVHVPRRADNDVPCRRLVVS